MRYLLAFFFFLMLAGDNLGLNVSLGAGVSTKNLLLYLIVAGIAVNAAVARNRAFELRAVTILFVILILYAFMTWAVLSFVFLDPAYETKDAFIALKNSLIDHFLTFFIFFFGLMSTRDAVWTLRAMAWLVVLGTVVTIVDTMNIPDLGILPPPRKEGRFEGFLGQPNQYGQFLVLFLPLCVAYFVTSGRRIRVLLAIGILASATALILTGSRGAYVGLLAGALAAAVYLRKHISTKLVLRASVSAAVFCTVVVAITFVTGYADLYMDRFAGLEGSSHVATSGRSTIWAEALDSMMQNPLSFLSGYGFYSYESSRSFRLSTHNIYLYYLYNLGLIGLSIFIALFARVIATARSAVADATGNTRTFLVAMIFGLLSFLAASFFADVHTVAYMLWAYVGTTMRVAMGVRQAETADAKEHISEVARRRPIPGFSRTASRPRFGPDVSS